MIAALIGRLSAVHDNHKRIASGALLVGMFTLGAKLFVAAREMAIAWRYGVSETVDAYQLAITTTTWVPMLVNGVVTIVLVPRLVGLSSDSPGRRKFISELNGTMLTVGVAVSALIWVAAPAIAGLLASGVNPYTLHTTAALAAKMAPVSAFLIICGYLSARLQSRQRFSYSASEAVPALVIALFLTLPFEWSELFPLIAGTLVGYALQVVVLGRMTQRGDPPVGGISIRHRSPEWSSLYGAVSLMVLGQLLLNLTGPIDQAFASRLGAGGVATLGYAARTVTLLTGLGAVVVARALLPVLSGAVAAGDLALGRRQAVQWSILLGGVAATAGVVLWLFAPLLVRLLFQRGAFDAAATAHVAHVLRFGLLQLPFYFASMVLIQWYAATSRFKALLVIYAVTLAFKIAMNAALAPVLGIAGIALSTSAMLLLTTLLLGFGVRGTKTSAA